MRVFGYTIGVIGGILAFIAVIAGMWGLVFAFQWFTAGPSGKLAARQQIQSGDYRIAAYNHFFDLCASVQTLDGNIVVQYQQLALTPKSDGTDRARILANIAGQESARNDGINQYNVDAQKGYTLGQFRASQLPYQLPNGPYQKGEKISCVS